MQSGGKLQMLIQNCMTSLSKIGKLGMRKVPSTNNISRMSMTGHMASHAQHNFARYSRCEKPLGFSESGTG